MKKTLIVLLVALLIFTAAGFADTITYTDALGRELTLETNPTRVAAMIGSFADVWCVAGGKDTLVAAANDAWTQFDNDLDPDVVANLGAVKEPNAEALLTAAPDLVLASVNTTADVEMLELFESAGIPVVYFEVDCFEDYLEMLDVCTQLTGRRDLYQSAGLDVQAQIENCIASVPETDEAPSFLYVRATGSTVKVKSSADTVLGNMLTDLGCTNIADSETSLLENLSIETIIVQDPDYIFVVLQGTDTTDARQNFEASLSDNPAWSSLTAVAEGRVYMVDQRLYNVKPNALWGMAYEQLAEILYPQD
ncbi:MAG: ABC transporter substrate-binding protein [Clostridia bacterium]|nr:ABC transporter substrate-binding protein [Clostridia bacterium]